MSRFGYTSLGFGSGASAAAAGGEIANAKSALFDGSGDFYSVGDSDFGTTNFTLMAWVRVASGGGICAILDASSNGGTIQGFHLRWGISSGDAKFRFIPYYSATPLSSYVVDTTDTLAVDTWGLVTATYDDATTTANVYINDGTPATNTGILLYSAAAGANFKIGAFFGGTYTFDGHMDDSAYWNTALSAAEIAEIYGLKASGELADLNIDSGDYASAANLVGWWRMGDNDTDPVKVENMATGAATAGSGGDGAQATASKQPSFTTEIPS